MNDADLMLSKLNDDHFVKSDDEVESNHFDIELASQQQSSVILIEDEDKDPESLIVMLVFPPEVLNRAESVNVDSNSK